MVQPLISVIIGFYNEHLYLREAIESVLNQSYTHWELFLADDGSSDGSTEIAKSYAQRNPGRIFYLEHPQHANKGVCATRNLALKQARGEFIALLDGDDVWLPRKLLQQVDTFARYPDAAMLCEASSYWYTWKDREQFDVTVPVGAGQDRLHQPPSLIHVLYPLGKGAAPCPSGLMIRRDVMLQEGGFEENFTGPYQMYEDQAYLCKIYLHHPVYITSACNNLYRQRQGSLVRWVTDEGRYHKVRKFFLEWLQQYLKRQRINDPAIHRLLRKALLPYRYPFLRYIKRLLSNG
ncbi:MAG TPA: glycosyltransferase family 2 protein [Chitinophagaceae bacterium]|nr:glycosyltransferase family 2 protein [Chitinophagaceae bacterium]